MLISSCCLVAGALAGALVAWRVTRRRCMLTAQATFALFQQELLAVGVRGPQLANAHSRVDKFLKARR